MEEKMSSAKNAEWKMRSVDVRPLMRHANIQTTLDT
jgi:hypothetical protein